jgi:hypothetical protein
MRAGSRVAQINTAVREPALGSGAPAARTGDVRAHAASRMPVAPGAVAGLRAMSDPESTAAGITRPDRAI